MTRRRRFAGLRSIVLSIGTAAVAATLGASSVHAESLLVLLKAYDPSLDPAIRYLTAASEITEVAWTDSIRWSVTAGVDYDYAGAMSIASTARLAVPIDAASRARTRAERERVDAELAELERASLSRDMTYGVLDLACRWGYLRATDPVLESLAARRGNERDLWLARHAAARSELDAVTAQIGAHAPGIADLLPRFPNFLCRLPSMPTPPTMDGLEQHPSLHRLALEDAQQVHQLAFSRGIGGPELSLDGSVRYGLAGEDVGADIRIAAHFPFSTAGWQGSVTTEADPFRTRVALRIESSTTPPKWGTGAEPKLQLARERASLQARVASASGVVGTLRATEDVVWRELARRTDLGPRSCASLCVVAAGPADWERLDLETLQLYLDALGITYELARAELELLRTLAVGPTMLTRRAASLDTRTHDPELSGHRHAGLRPEEGVGSERKASGSGWMY